jgi:hypothetical protein
MRAQDVHGQGVRTRDLTQAVKASITSMTASK